MTDASLHIEAVTQAVKHEIFGMMGLQKSAWAQKLFSPIFHLPVHKLAALLVELDHDVQQSGWCKAAKNFLSHFIEGFQVSGEERIPPQGALLVASNHPAAYDSVILASVLGREDLKIISSTISILPNLPHIYQHFIFIGKDVDRRMTAVREALRHLRNGGALLIFPRGDVEPDPTVSPGIEQSLEKWSPSLELFLRKAPETQTVVTMVRGVLAKGWFRNPLVRMWKKPEQKQKVAEIFQVAEQLVFSRRVPLKPMVRFSLPLTLADLEGATIPGNSLLQTITQQARLLLKEDQAQTL